MQVKTCLFLCNLMKFLFSSLFSNRLTTTYGTIALSQQYLASHAVQMTYAMA